MVARPEDRPEDDVLFARGLRHAHRGSPALLGVSLGVRQGEILGVLGPHAAGKTTLLRCLAGEIVPDEGEVWFNSAPVHPQSRAVRERLRREHFGWVGPRPHLLPELTVRENAALPLLLCGATHRAAHRGAQEWLDRLDIGDLAARRPEELLQSERQRAAIARALVGAPDVVFADEPTAPLHRADRAQTLRMLTSAARSHGITVVLASNDAEVVAGADRVLSLADGRAVPGVPLQDREGAGSCSTSV
jgi:putative ABC transport system ATP-binding protein